MQRIDRDLATLKGVLEDWPAKVTGNELAATKELFLATVTALTDCVAAHPNDRDIAWRLGECYRLGNNLEAQKQHVADSKKFLDRALELDENYVPAYIPRLSSCRRREVNLDCYECGGFFSGFPSCGLDPPCQGRGEFSIMAS